MLSLFYLGIFLLMTWGLRLRPREAMTDCLAPRQTRAVCGLFILMVFGRHLQQYVPISDSGPSLFGGEHLNKLSGQLIVVMFLFYSGYGVARSILNKGRKYVLLMPRHRILNTLLNFDVAVCIFSVLGLLIGVRIGIGQFLLSLLCWDDVGNSNWYIFTILLCYLFSYLVARFVPRKWMSFTLTVICAILVLALVCVRPGYWSNTLMAFPMGFVMAQYEEHVWTFVEHRYVVCLMTMIALFIGICYFPWERFNIVYNARSVCFAGLVVLLSMKVSVTNPVLEWLGAHLFPLYIYQRIPMLLIPHFAGQSFVVDYTYLYAILCLLVTVLIALCYPLWQVKLVSK